MTWKEQQNTKHLTPEEFGELIESGEAGADSVAQTHLAGCEECRKELSYLMEGLALFRESASAYAKREFARARHVKTSFVPVHRGFSAGLGWAAAGLLAIAAALPIQLQRHARQPLAVTQTTASVSQARESDEALLEDINREVSASVPASMQALEDPTGSPSRASSDGQISTTRKN